MRRQNLFTSNTSETDIENYLLQENDYQTYKNNSTRAVAKFQSAHETSWKLFLKEEINTCAIWSNTEKLLLLKAAFQCIKNPMEKSDFAQFLKSVTELKKYVGVRIFSTLFSANVPAEQRELQNYSHICRLLIELRDQAGLLDLIKTNLPNLMNLRGELEAKHATYLQSKFPKRSTDELIATFATKNDLVKFPLDINELNYLKPYCELVIQHADTVRKLSLAELKEAAKNAGALYKNSKGIKDRCLLVAIISEAIYRSFKIKPHDTQILSILALLNSPEKLKGRIAQIKAGEGKSTIIAILAALSALGGNFVDIVTSSSNLAIRDAKKYAKLYANLGLTSSHICGEDPTPEQFYGQILYGTNTDYEFAYLRDGLYQEGLRQSSRDGKLQPRTFDTAIVDEVDNLFIDTALNSALMSVSGKADLAWIHAPLFNKVKENSKITVDDMREYLLNYEQGKYRESLSSLKNKQLKRLINSTKSAIHRHVHGVHYYVKNKRDKQTGKEQDEITINDYENTGQFQEGSQWRNGLYQALQVKHNLPVTPESLTAASVSHPTYFGLYRHILALTGTMGELVEREEVKKIYNIDCFDVPPHFPCQRIKHPANILTDKQNKFAAILKSILGMREKKRPSLVLFKTINESNEFSEYLKSHNVNHNVLNAIQRESEDYIVTRAGDAGVITVATNTAGRGTDVILTAESFDAGGLHQIFAFYTKNPRVNDQGEARAARQGQPGSCEHILSWDDDYIHELILRFGVNINGHINDLSLVINLPISDDNKIKLLDQLRTKDIENESALRYQGSLKEAIYFEKIQYFFGKIKEVNEIFSNNDFKASFVQSCQSLEKLNSESIDIKLSDEWKDILTLVKKLLLQQYQGTTLDWSHFYDVFKSTFQHNMTQRWAEFYNQLHDEIESTELEFIKNDVNKLYQLFEPKLNNYFLNPNQNALKILQAILLTAKKELNSLFLDKPHLSEQVIKNNSIFGQTEIVNQTKVETVATQLYVNTLQH